MMEDVGLRYLMNQSDKLVRRRRIRRVAGAALNSNGLKWPKIGKPLAAIVVLTPVIVSAAVRFVVKEIANNLANKMQSMSGASHEYQRCCR